MSLRTRLVLGAAATVALAIVLASGLVYFLVRNELRGQLDESLQNNAATIANQRHPFGATRVVPHVYQLYTAGTPFVGYYQLVDAVGNVYIADYFMNTLRGSKPLLKVTPQAVAVAAGRAGPFYYDTELQGQDTRVYTIATPNNLYAIQVIEPLSGVDHELAKIRLWLLLVALGGVALASGAGLLVARSTLRPVRDLSETAERVRTTRDLSQRISVGGSDELSQLARTFNEMLAALDEAAQRQQRLVQDASHELRTPLTSLRTNIEVLAGDAALPPEDRAQLLHDVIEQLGEMTALVSELTELARGEEQASALEEVRLDLLTGDAIRRTSRNHPDVAIDAELRPTRVVGTAANLERAVANLLDNAAKWSPPGSAVEVGVADGELSVRDHGPGIAETDVPHIFERFYRAASARSMPGSGLGLAIVRQVAEAHGGTIRFEPAPGGGTLMRLRLPTRDGPAPENEEPPSPPRERASAGAGAPPEGRWLPGAPSGDAPPARRTRFRPTLTGAGSAEHGGRTSAWRGPRRRGS
jgi:two-component system sensor histidine kinase MprB